MAKLAKDLGEQHSDLVKDVGEELERAGLGITDVNIVGYGNVEDWGRGFKFDSEDDVIRFDVLMDDLEIDDWIWDDDTVCIPRQDLYAVYTTLRTLREASR